MELFNERRIGRLTRDIEGSEIEVLRGSHPWMAAVCSLIGELHDRFRPGSTAALKNALSGFAHARTQSGEQTVIGSIRAVPRALTPAISLLRYRSAIPQAAVA